MATESEASTNDPCKPDSRLTDLYNETNDAIFDGKLPPPRVVKCDGLVFEENSVGQYVNGKISIDSGLVPPAGAPNLDAARKVMIHEQCHLKSHLDKLSGGLDERHHGPIWQACMKDAAKKTGESWPKKDAARYRLGERQSNVD